MVSFPLGIHARRVLAASLLALVLLVVAWRHASSGSSGGAHALRVAPIVPASASAGGPGPRARTSLVVDVAGAVRRPGLVHLPPGARVADAVARAGGLARRAERAAVNFAAPVSDGQQVVVPGRGSPGAGAGAAAGVEAPAVAGPVSLSSATAEQLDALPGVGPVTAEKIVAYREQHGSFHSVDELDAIPGIGPARIADLRGLVVP